MAPERTSILFVCLGNICRSPLAEGIFRHLVAERGLGETFEVDSAGTGDYHLGEPPDRRAAEVARDHGITLTGRARALEREDLNRFDLIVAMDRSNFGHLQQMQRIREDHSATLRLLREFDPEAGEELDVPDPYYEGGGGFEQVFSMIERACRRLLDHLAPAQPAE